MKSNQSFRNFENYSQNSNTNFIDKNPATSLSFLGEIRSPPEATALPLPSKPFWIILKINRRKWNLPAPVANVRSSY